MTAMTFSEWFEDRYGETPQSAREEGMYYLEELGDAFAAGYAAGKNNYMNAFERFFGPTKQEED